MQELHSNIENNITKELTEIYKKYFKDSTITFNGGYLGDKTTIFVNCYLAKNDKELINGYKENDMFSISFVIREKNDTYDFENLSKSYLIKPQNKYLAYSRTMLKFRKINGDEQKIAKGFEKFIKNLKEQLQSDINNDLIHKNFIELLKSKI